MMALGTKLGASTVPSLGKRAGAESQPSDPLALWWAPLDVSRSALGRFAACLSPEEWQRADRCRRPVDRLRFLAAKGWLRQLLASQLGCAPADVQIVTGDYGKPKLVSSDIDFSASRTTGVALYATSRTSSVGVDIEAIRESIDVDGMAATFMSPREQGVLASLPPRERRKAFFDCWTRKEAYGKCLGTGLRFAVRDVDVWHGSRQPATVDEWTVHQIDVAPGFAAAVAGADLDNWVPPSPRPLATAVLDLSRRSPGAEVAAPAMPAR